MNRVIAKRIGQSAKRFVPLCAMRYALCGIE